jgi:hypothetical protein
MFRAPNQTHPMDSVPRRLRWSAGPHPRSRIIAGFLSITLALLGLSLTRAASATAAPTGTLTKLTPKTTTSLTNVGNHDLDTDSGDDDQSLLLNSFQQGEDQIRTPAAFVPDAAPTTVLTATSRDGFDGITHLDQLHSDPGHQRQAPPPDQALCAGNGYLLEGVNSAVRVHASDGTPLTGTVAMSQLMGDGHEIISTDPLVLGHLHSDPRCMFDADTGRFFVTSMRYHIDPHTNEPTGRAAIELAVSNGPDPRGNWDVYALDSTGDASDPAGAFDDCPCIGDFPSLGADSNGIYTGYNLYSNESGLRVGARLVAISKHQLTDSHGLTAVTFAFAPDSQDLLNPHFSMSPAVTPPDGSFDSRSNGTEWVLASHGHAAGPINVIAVTNTNSLNSPTPHLLISSQDLNTETFFSLNPLPAVEQRDGPRPLAASIQLQDGGAVPPLEFLQMTGSRMRTVEYADGRLWASTNTLIQPPHGPVRTGVAWFQITPAIEANGTVTAAIANQGYLIVDRQNLLNPAIAVNSHGVGAMVFTLVGPDYYPSAAYVPIDENGTGQVHIFGPGAAPIDDADGYAATSGASRVARFGDYSAATVDEAGAIWLATEYVGALPRSTRFNWDTRIIRIDQT